jgi:hypothetical protein
MTRKTTTPVSHTNRKGRTYYLHAAVRKSGKTVYVMKTSAQGALTKLPEGYVITESVNGEVSVGRPKPGQITEQEAAQVAAALERLGLKHYRYAAKGMYITIYEPLHSEADLRETASLLAGPLSGRFESWISHKLTTEPLEPVMRFQLVDKDQRLFAVERMTYRGEGGWKSLWHVETLPELARKYLPHLGRESLFELI